MIRRAGAAGVSVVAKTREAAPYGERAVRAESKAVTAVVWSGKVLGRYAPGEADAKDAQTATDVTQRLAAYGIGRAAVVVRDHVLAIAAAEGPVLMAQRIAALRQWGRGRVIRTAGAAAVNIDPAGDVEADLTGTITALATAGIAGVAVVRTSGNAVQDVPTAAIAAADRLGMYLIEIARASTAKAV